MPVFGAENIAAPYLPALAVAPLPLCLWWGRAVCTQSASSPLVFAQSLFCEWARLRVSSLLTFVGKFSLSLFFFSSLATPQFGLLSHISSLRAFRPGPYPKDRRCLPHLPVQPQLASGRCEHLGYFSGRCS